MTLKKLIVLTAAAVAGITAGGQVTQPQAPDWLKPGDKIAIISPGSTPRDSIIPQRASDVLRQWGYKPVIGRHAMERYHHYAGTARQRADDLLWALRDPSIKAIIATRGGYGSSQLLLEIPGDTLARYPKWLVGYSDITALHSALTRAGVMSIHGNMCGALADDGPDGGNNPLLRDLLAGTLPHYVVPGNPLNRPGHARGILVGGNFSVLTNMSGSRDRDFLDPDFLDGRDIILFIEDVGESMARVNQMVTLLKLKGVFNHVRGIVLGRFTDYKPAAGYNDMNEMLAEYLAEFDVPVCFDFPASHDEQWNMPLVEGCPVTLDVTGDRVRLDFDLY